MPQNLDAIRPGARVLIDANIILYASSQRSQQCASLIRRCAHGAVEGVITSMVLGELCHGWMMEEARSKNLVTSPNPARQIARSPAIIPQLSEYQQLTTAVIHGALEIEPVERDDFIAALQIQRRWSLMTNDSLLLAVAQRLGIREIATADRHFDDIQGWIVYRPDDLPLVP